MNLSRNSKRNLHKIKARQGGVKMQEELAKKIVDTIQENSRNELLYVMIIGGQSYYLSQDKSDIDILAITSPKMTEVTFSKNTGNSHSFYEIDGKTIDVKYTDLRTFLSQLSKGNSSSILEVANLETDREFLLFEKDNGLTTSILNVLKNYMNKDFWEMFFKSINGQILGMKRNQNKLMTAKQIAFIKMLIEFLDNYLEHDVFSNKFSDEKLQQLLKLKYETADYNLSVVLEDVEKEVDALVEKFEADDSFEYSDELLRTMEEKLSMLLIDYIIYYDNNHSNILETTI